MIHLPDRQCPVNITHHAHTWDDRTGIVRRTEPHPTVRCPGRTGKSLQAERMTRKRHAEDRVQHLNMHLGKHGVNISARMYQANPELWEAVDTLIHGDTYAEAEANGEGVKMGANVTVLKGFKV